MVENFKGRSVPLVGGIVVLLGLLASVGVMAVFGLIRPGTLDQGGTAFSPSALAITVGSTDHTGVVIAALGFFALGLIDDLAGAGTEHGFRGHVRALLRGRVTAGAIKAAGGGMVALVAAAQWSRSIADLLVQAAIVALAANLFNLLDLRPGRAVKAQLVVWAPLAAAGWSSPWFALSAAVVAASLVWLPADLAERGMLGDGGANLIGAVIGAGLALTLGDAGRIAGLGVLTAMTGAAEWRSFSSIVDRFRLLGFLDRLGRSEDKSG